ncbi:sarcosine dehydrogenase, mitochondrial isoform X2 [Talpa occidentalis]|uniref:sarcosine dehydrogenase, mitochondrial isoform X2 n=1 Tax=Talpa occidentalis TaxID=50954 RepID=UPI0023F9065E|nr:sarcosine dehydrogenase, mitochondrial isoform X2 [Talpa occidentalis]
MHAPLNWPGIFGLLPRSAGPSQPDARSTLLSTATGQTWGGGEWPQPGSHFSPPPARLSLAPAALAAGVTMASLSRALRVAATRPRGSPALRPLTSAAGPTAEKSVPYQRTLKEGSSEVASGPSRPLPSTANVVVIGGGSLGCQTLYHLAKLGVSGAVLLERDRLTSGTTWHTAGLLWQLRPSDVEVELLAHTRRVVSRDLEQETGLHTGWIQNGGLFIASNRQRLDEYKRLMSLGKAYGVESHVLGPEETKALYPLMNVDDLYGTLYVPHDGTMDPAGTCTTLTRAATARGAQVIENCPVTGIRVRTDDFGVRRVAAVETEHGTIQTPCVVNCAGVWAGAVGRMAGVKVPLVAMHHAYVVTERIEGIQNMPNVRDHDASVYLRLQGDALSVGGYENNPIFWEEVSDKFAFGLFDLDWDVFTQHIEGAINRVPVLEKTGIKSTVCGPESFTPDHKPLMGEAPELRGFFLGCGFNSAGMMLGGGCGQELAHWIIHGRPEKDMYGYDIRRFHHSLTDHRRWVRERSHESYAKNYSVVFPHDEPLAGRNMRTDALHQELLARGCVFQERHGWERPGWFSPRGTAPIRKECLTCRGAAAVFDMSYFGKFYLVGLDARKAADWLFSADVSRPPGSTVYTCMLNHRGGTESDLTVSRLAPGPQDSPLVPAFEGDAYYLAVGGAVAQHNWSHISTVLQDQRLRCQLIDSSEDLGMISIQGPASRAILQEVLDTDLSNEAFPFSTHKLVKAAGHLVRAMRLSFVGELGWELHIPGPSCVPVYQAVMAAGAKHGLVNAGYRAIDSLSIEKGYRHWHADLRSDDSPLEAGLAFTCKLKSAVPFLGREALEQQRAEGLRRRLVCFTVDEKVPMFGLEAIWRNGQVVGHVRRADFGFTLDKTVAYGYIRDPSGGPVSPDFVKSGDYALERMGVTYPARAHLKSPFDPDNKRVKGLY